MSGGAGRRSSGPRAVRQRLESLAASGVDRLPRPGRAGRPDRAAAQERLEPAEITTTPAAGLPMAPSPPPPAPPAAAAAADPAAALAVIAAEVAACTRCPALVRGRTNTVFGSGAPVARLCFMGEAPGADEDASGLPFVGRAGQLLTKIIEACTLTRDEVYILNVLKCRPPDNRQPLPEETANCRGFFERQLDLIRPGFICCLGATAAQALLGTAEPIGRLRKRWVTHGSAQVICTYHPSYLLRNPAAKREVWDDMKLLMARMGLPGGRG